MQYKNELNAYVIIVVTTILTNVLALIFQLILNEIPCPLCILQRFGLLGVAYGGLKVISSQRAEGILIIVLSTLFTLLVAARQISLHICTNDGGYGPPFFGLHFYTWSALLSLGVLLIMAIAPLLNYINFAQYVLNYKKLIYNILFYIVLGLSLINMASTFMECGFTGCSEDPKGYMFHF